MLTQSEFKQGLSVVFASHPQLEPKKSADLIYKMWFSMFKDLDGQCFLNAVTRFVVETPKLYPGDNFIAIIRQIAVPTLQETEGDAIELAFEAARNFGRMREAEAMAWLKEKSPLIASVVGRFGFREICTSTEPDVIRGQLRAIFKGEKERSRQVGGIVESAKHLSGGGNKQLLPLLGKIGNKCLADESKGGAK